MKIKELSQLMYHQRGLFHEKKFDKFEFFLTHDQLKDSIDSDGSREVTIEHELEEGQTIEDYYKKYYNSTDIDYLKMFHVLVNVYIDHYQPRYFNVKKAI